MKTAAFGLALLALTPGLGRSQPADGDPACGVARFVMADTPSFGRPLAFVSDPPSTRERFADSSLAQFIHLYVEPSPNAAEDADNEAYGWFKDPPSEALARRFLASDDRTRLLKACPGLIAEFRAKGIAIDIRGYARPREDGFYRHIYVRLGVPVVSDDGLEALVALGRQSGPLAGGGSLLHLRRGPDGAWQVVDEIWLWVS